MSGWKKRSFKLFFLTGKFTFISNYFTVSPWNLDLPKRLLWKKLIIAQLIRSVQDEPKSAIVVSTSKMFSSQLDYLCLSKYASPIFFNIDLKARGEQPLFFFSYAKCAKIHLNHHLSDNNGFSAQNFLVEVGGGGSP